MKKTIKMLVGTISAISMLTLSGLAGAATVQIKPSSIMGSYDLGTSFQFIIEGINFPDTNGGGVRLSWVDADLTLLSTDAQLETDMNNAGFNFSGVTHSGGAGTLDLVPGVFFATSPTGSFDIATLSFMSNLVGSTDLTISMSPAQPTWKDGSDVNLVPQPSYGGITSVTINPTGVSAVPVPAAAWLFASGLFGMVGVVRRRNL